MTSAEHARRFISRALILQNEHANETRIRDNFTSYLRSMFPDNPKWVNYHIEGAETHVHLVRQNRQVSGFIDNCIDSIAIEYEKNLSIDSIFDEGYRQVKEYCAALVRDHIPFELIQGVLSDTLRWHVYEIVPKSGLLIDNYTADNIILNEISSFDASQDGENVANDFLRFLEKTLGRQGGRTITAKRLAEDFGLQSIYSERYRTAIHEYVSRKIEANPSYYNLVEELWNKFVESHSVSRDNTAFYIDEFYISIIAKLLCANLINKNALSLSAEQLQSIIIGEFFENKNIENFVEYDYFGWINADIAEISDILSLIQEDLKVYDFSTSPEEDLFGELLVQLANTTQRILLGQELTPRWLAKELVINVAHKLPAGTYPRFVDMCCGSGSMIVETIKATESMIPSSVDSNLKDQILRNCISGFDIDPLAVMLAKINWLINIFDLVNHDKELFIPIYHADSLFVDNPITTKNQKTEDSSYNLVLIDREVRMPEYAISSEYRDVFDLIVNKCYDCIHTPIDKTNFLTIIQTLLREQITQDEQLSELSEFAYNLYRVLYQLDLEGKNGIWSFILKNSFRPSLISARFNGIVSNTPWLAMSKIGSNPYRFALKSIAKGIGINPTDSSFPHLELATVFLLSSIHRYLEEDGVFGCILPDSVLNGGQHTKFRIGKFADKGIKANFEEIWSLPINTFKNKSIALFGTKHSFSAVTQYAGRIYTDKTSFATSEFKVSEVTSKSVWTTDEINDINDCVEKYSFKQGADIMPRCFFFFTINDMTDTVRLSSIKEGEEYSYFRKDQKIGKNISFSANGVPKSLLKSVLISNILLPFNIGRLPYAILPIEKRENKWHEISHTTILSFQRSVINLFSNIKRTYKEIKGKDDMYGNTLNMRNKLEQQNLEVGKYLVVYGAGGKNICSAYMYIDNAEQYIIDQTLYWTVVDTEEEAIYLSSILNCPTLNDTITAFQPQGIFGERHVHTLPIEFIPKYDPNNSQHINLINEAKILCEELSTALTTDITNPNNGTLPARRKKAFNILSNLAHYVSYVTCCETVLRNDNKGLLEEPSADITELPSNVHNLSSFNNIKNEYVPDTDLVDDNDTLHVKITPLHDEYQLGCVPLFTLRAACGYFDEGQLPEADGWVDATGHGFAPDPKRHFAVRAKGDSMLPDIHDGDICIFEWYTAGTRRGEIVLTRFSDYDPDYGGQFTIKRYYSEKTITEDGWQHTKIELRPSNPDFDTIILEENDNIRTVGIFKCIVN